MLDVIYLLVKHDSYFYVDTQRIFANMVHLSVDTCMRLTNMLT